MADTVLMLLSQDVCVYFNLNFQGILVERLHIALLWHAPQYLELLKAGKIIEWHLVRTRVKP